MLPPAPERQKASRSCRLKALAEKLDRLVEDFEKPLRLGGLLGTKRAVKQLVRKGLRRALKGGLSIVSGQRLTKTL